MSCLVIPFRRPNPNPSLSPDSHNRLRSCLERLEKTARDWLRAEQNLSEEIAWSNAAPTPYQARLDALNAQISSCKARLQAEVAWARGILHINASTKAHLRHHPDVRRYEQRLQPYLLALEAGQAPPPPAPVADLEAYAARRAKRA